MAVPTLLAEGDTTKLRQHCTRRMQELEERRQPWLDFTRQVAEELLPNRLPYLNDPHGLIRGGEQNTHIVDAVGHLSLDTSSAGIISGTMPPTSPWFELKVRNEFDDATDEEDREYLEETARRLLARHNQSNANHVLPEPQKEWLAFGTGAVLLLEDDEDGHRLDHLSAGEYCIADDHRGRVDTLYRKLTMTVGQLAEEFGVDRLSTSSRAAYEIESFDMPVPCVHAIEPDRDGLNPYGRTADLPWRSVYYEESAGATEVLAVRGYTRFPALVWRWGKLPGSAYGYGRGHDVLPHLVRLRRLIYRYGQALAFKSEPPVQVPAGMQQHEVRMLPGGKTSVFGQAEIKNLFRVDLELREVGEEIERTRQDIRDTLGATLVASLRRITHQMTAREADLRTSQDLTEFLPALYRLNEELLSPYIEWIYEIADSQGLLPPVPESLQDKVVDIEYTSPLARKQSEAEVEAIVRTYAIAGEIAKVRKDVLDNLNVDGALRRIAQILGCPTSTLEPIENVRQMRQANAQRMQAEAAAAAAEQGVGMAKVAAEAGSLAEVA